MKAIALEKVLRPARDPVRVDDPKSAKLISVRLYGQGAVCRDIRDGKEPKPFTGNRGRAGQFVFSRIWARRGAMALIPPGLDGVVVTNEFPLFDVDEQQLDSRYLNYFVQTPRFLAELERVSAGASGQNRVKEAAFLALELPLPSLDEQRRIAVILDRADALRVRRRDEISFLRELSSVLYERATSGADERTVQELLDASVLAVHKDGNHGSLYPRPEEFAPEGVPFLTAKAIRDDGSVAADRVDHLIEEKASQLRIGWIQDGDVLLSHNASVGKVAVYEGQFGRALIGTSLTCFRADATRLVPDFLAASLRADAFQRQLKHDMAQTTRNQVPITAQRKLSLRWIEPERQRQLASSLEPVASRMAAVRRLLNLADELFASLQSRAFQGEL